MYPNTNLPSRQAVNALLIGRFGADRGFLRQLFRNSGWKLRMAANPRRALTCLHRNLIHVVLASSEIPGWTWQTVLHEVSKLSPRPALVVVSRLADDRLWAEVLNLGGYDLLAQPFDRSEVERVVLSARRHFDPPSLRLASASAA